MKIFKPKFWGEKNHIMSFFLLPLSFVVQLFVIFKKKKIKQEKFSIPVICIGNLYLGGTGKTPLSIEVCKILKKRGKKVAIIKKFYRKHTDEFNLIESKKVKLFKNTSRVFAINKAVSKNFECVILDDGLQDASINKSLSIVCFNSKQLIGNGMTLPSGPLREPFSSLKKSQIVVINGNKNTKFEKKIKNISNAISIYYSNYYPHNLSRFKGKNLIAFAGIANPENFFSLLKKNNLKVVKKVFFPDHYQYSLEELKKLINYSQKKNLELITTEKDYFRIKHYKLTQINYLSVNLKIIHKKKFENEVVKYL